MRPRLNDTSRRRGVVRRAGHVVSDFVPRYYQVYTVLAQRVLHLLYTAVFAHEPRAIFQLRGAWGEDNTRTEVESGGKK